MKTYSFLLACIMGIALNSTFAQSIHAPLRKGDRAYDRVQYKDAETQYRIAADRDIGNPKAVYNLANALFQQGNFEDAGTRFKQAAEESKDPTLRADALHNLGDSFLKQRKFKEAIQAYEASLRLRPGDEGSKQNLQMAKKKLREEEQKEKEKQQQNQSQQDQKNQDQNQQNPQDPQQQHPQDQPPKQDQPNPNKQEPPKGTQKESPPEQDPQQLQKEEAKRLLETAVGQDDRKNARKYRSAKQQTKSKGAKKDW